MIFGAGHAPYPAQPSFARPVELILPSIGFGLLYLYFGLLPGIILHFAFDVVWFALPIFLAKAPGIWVQQVMVVVMTLVPLWVVLVRRVQAGRWTELPGSRAQRGMDAAACAGACAGRAGRRRVRDRQSETDDLARRRHRQPGRVRDRGVRTRAAGLAVDRAHAKPRPSPVARSRREA